MLARQYFDRLKAPRKQFFSFSSTTHSPLYEHPEVFHRLLLEHVLPKDAKQELGVEAGE